MQKHHRIGIVQRRRQRLRMRAQSHRIAARLHRHHHTRCTDSRTQALQRGRDRGGMVCKVVVDGDSARAPNDFQPPLDALEVRQSRHHRCWIYANCVYRRQRRQPVQHVVPPKQRPLHVTNLRATVQHRKGAAISRNQPRAPVQRGIEPELLHRRPAAHRQHLGQVRVFAIDDQRPRAGTVRTRWWNWRWIAATSGKISAWSYSRLLRIATNGR